MKVKKFIFLFILIQGLVCFALDRDIPFLLWNSIDNNKIMLSTNKFNDIYNDSLKVRFKVYILLEYPLKDKTKPIKVKQVKLNNISVKKDDSEIWNISKNDTNKFKRNLWLFTDSVVSHWYKNQHYENLSDYERSKWDHQIVMAGGFYIIKMQNDNK